MKKLVALYVGEIQRSDSGVTLQDVPALLRTQVDAAIAEMTALRQEEVLHDPT